MSSIDEVISRSRQPGKFTERRTFTVARGRAIQKLREFALVDPHYYILELIQSAVSNGATFIDIQCDRTEVGVSYIGGSFHEAELAQLFDFLFASKDDVDHGPLRLLALGVNALMNFSPKTIVIETGDGTLKGTTRIEIRGSDDVVEVGRPDKALSGTFLRATGLKRRQTSRLSALAFQDGNPPEYAAVEARCIVAPVPILFNNHPVFGYSRQRTPKSLWGLSNELTFDEGDLYGAIGISQRRTGAVFRLVTQGVWIESARRDFRVGNAMAHDIGGVISFDRLRKTADHSSIVQDEIFEEMWLRLQPYVNRLKGQGEDHSGYDVTTLDGESLAPTEVMSVLREFPRVVIVPKASLGAGDADQWDPERVALARQVGDSLDAPVVAVRASHLESVRSLAGVEVHIITPDLENQEELEFYLSPAAQIPPRPWLIAPEPIGKATLFEVAGALPFPAGMNRPQATGEPGAPTQDELERIVKSGLLLGERPREGESIGEWKVRRLDRRGESIFGWLYSPEEGNEQRGDHTVEVRAVDRVIYQGEHEAVTPGQLAIIDIRDVAPGTLERRLGGTGPTVGEILSSAILEQNLTTLESAGGRALRSALRAEVQPGSQAAILVLSSLSQRLVKRIEKGRVRFASVDPTLEAAVLEIPLLQTLEGRLLSLRDLETLLAECNGLVYGVCEGVDPDLEGLDQSKILALTPAEEKVLTAIIGPSAYVRVDRRDVLAEANDVVVRDFARGLKEYPDFPLLVEGRAVESGAFAATSNEVKFRVAHQLLGQLLQRIETVPEDWDEQEHRRQAWRHLQYFAIHRGAHEATAEQDHFVDKLPLFRQGDGTACSYGALKRFETEGGALTMLDGWSQSAAEEAFRDVIQGQDASDRTADGALSMNTFLLFALGERVEGAAEQVLSTEALARLDGDGETQFLAEHRFHDELFQGVIGVPQDAVDDPGVLVFGADHKTVVFRRDLGETFGVVGKIRLRPGASADEVEARLAAGAQEIVGHVLASLSRHSDEGGERYHRGLQVVLDYAGAQLGWDARSDHSVVMDLKTALARQIMNTPLFSGPRGVPMSPLAICRAFQRQAAVALAEGRAEIELQFEGLSEFPPAVKGWIGKYLSLQKVNRPSCYRERTRLEYAEEQTPLEATLEYWIHRLRPDTDRFTEDRRLTEAARIRMAGKGQFSGPTAEDFCLLRMLDRNREELWINSEHWLARWLDREVESSPRAIAFGVLAAYAHLNNLREFVTNEHELIFQQRVIQALESGELGVQRSVV